MASEVKIADQLTDMVTVWCVYDCQFLVSFKKLKCWGQYRRSSIYSKGEFYLADAEGRMEVRWGQNFSVGRGKSRWPYSSSAEWTGTEKFLSRLRLSRTKGMAYSGEVERLQVARDQPIYHVLWAAEVKALTSDSIAWTLPAWVIVLKEIIETIRSRVNQLFN
jgi:hypothetical protein